MFDFVLCNKKIVFDAKDFDETDLYNIEVM